MVEPPICDRPKCQVEVVAYGRWSFTGDGRLPEVRPQGTKLKIQEIKIFQETVPVVPLF